MTDLSMRSYLFRCINMLNKSKKTLIKKLNVVESLVTYAVRLKSELIFGYYKLSDRHVRTAHSKSITLLPHEGLGDLISLLPALRFLESEGVDITLVADKYKWDQIKNTFIDVPCVNVKHYIEDGGYSVPDFLPDIQNSLFVALGHYSNFPIVDYPCSFYWQVGVDSKIASNYLQLKPCQYKFELPKNFIFIDLNTSKNPLSKNFIVSAKNSIMSISNTEVVVSENGVERRLLLDKEFSFHQKLCIALKAEKIICSDAGFFNALIRLEKRPELSVHTRKHRHTHFSGIYGGCKFDGRIYIFNSKS